MQNSMVMLIFSALDWKHPIKWNSVQKVKIVDLNWNSNMQNSMVVFTFSVLFWKDPIW